MVQTQYYPNHDPYKKRLELFSTEVIYYRSTVGVSVTISRAENAITTDPFFISELDRRGILNAFLHATVAATLSGVINFLNCPLLFGFLDARSYVANGQAFVSVLMLLEEKQVLGSAKIVNDNDVTSIARAAAEAVVKPINNRLAEHLTTPASNRMSSDWSQRSKTFWRHIYDRQTKTTTRL
jgi:hypothetical protein